MKLTPHETGTPLWGKLEQHYRAELERLRARAENPEMPETERIGYLWRMKQIKEFLALAEPEQKGDGRRT